jgi:hypothetical protein
MAMRIEFGEIPWGSDRATVEAGMQLKGLRGICQDGKDVRGQTRMFGLAAAVCASVGPSGLDSVGVLVALNGVDVWESYERFVSVLQDKYGTPRFSDATYSSWEEPECASDPSSVSVSLDQEGYEHIWIHFESPAVHAEAVARARQQVQEEELSARDLL